MGYWTPRGMPKLRDRTCEVLGDPQSSIRQLADVVARQRGGDPTNDAIPEIAPHLAAAELFWVAAPMAALAVSSAATLPEVRWTEADRPSQSGLLIWEDGVGAIGQQLGVQVPVSAMSWGPHPEGLVVWLYIDRRTLLEWASIHAEFIPPLVPIMPVVLPVSSDWSPVEEVGSMCRTPLTALAAAWLLMQQPKLVEVTQVDRDPKLAKTYARANRTLPDVKLVELRRQYVPHQGRAEADGPGRTYRHRWVVAGHWRQQAHGPGRTQRRPTYIETHIKGPDGAPLLATAQVNVWRR